MLLGFWHRSFLLYYGLDRAQAFILLLHSIMTPFIFSCIQSFLLLNVLPLLIFFSREYYWPIYTHGKAHNRINWSPLKQVAERKFNCISLPLLFRKNEHVSTSTLVIFFEQQNFVFFQVIFWFWRKTTLFKKP